MSLEDIATEIRQKFTEGEDWAKRVLDKHVPEMLAVAEKIQADPLVKVAEELELTTQERQALADFLGVLGKRFPAAPVTDPAADTEASPDREPDTQPPAVEPATQESPAAPVVAGGVPQ